MKDIIAYALVIIGVPIFIGNLFAMIFSMPFSFIIGITRRRKETLHELAEASDNAYKWSFRGRVKMDARDRAAHTFYDILFGFGAILTAGFLFHLFKLSPNLAMLIIVVAWETFFAIGYSKSFRALFGSIIGIVIGWFVILQIFL